MYNGNYIIFTTIEEITSLPKSGLNKPLITLYSKIDMTALEGGSNVIFDKRIKEKEKSLKE